VLAYIPEKISDGVFISTMQSVYTTNVQLGTKPNLSTNCINYFTRSQLQSLVFHSLVVREYDTLVIQTSTWSSRIRSAPYGKFKPATTVKIRYVP